MHRFKPSSRKTRAARQVHSSLWRLQSRVWHSSSQYRTRLHGHLRRAAVAKLQYPHIGGESSMPMPPNKQPEMGLRYDPLSSRSYGVNNTGLCDMNAHRNPMDRASWIGPAAGRNLGLGGPGRGPRALCFRNPHEDPGTPIQNFKQKAPAGPNDFHKLQSVIENTTETQGKLDDRVLPQRHGDRAFALSVTYTRQRFARRTLRCV